MMKEEDLEKIRETLNETNKDLQKIIHQAAEQLKVLGFHGEISVTVKTQAHDRAYVAGKAGFRDDAKLSF